MKKRIAGMLLTCLIAFSASVGLTESRATAAPPDYSDAVGHVVLDSWVGPHMTDEAYREYAECGYNRVHFNNTSVHVLGGSSESDYRYLGEKLDTHFTLAEKYGIDVILAMNAINMNETSPTPFEWVDKTYHDTLQKWKDSDTFCGYMPNDEPTFALSLVGQNESRLQRDYEKITDYILDEYIYFKHNYPGKKFEVVLLGDMNRGETMAYQKAGLETYEEYLGYYYDNVMQYMPYEDRVWSMDRYPFSIKNDGESYYIRDGFISSLEDLGYMAEATHGEKWTYMQNHTNVLNKESVLYQYYTAMAYGYTNFVTYCYRDAWSSGGCSIDDLGRKTDNYYYYQAAHKEIKSFENVYMQFVDDWKGVLVCNGSESTIDESDKPWATATKLLSSYEGIRNFTATQDALIGIMRDGNGYDGYMLSNQVYPFGNTENTVSVTFADAEAALVYTKGQPVQTVPLDNGTLTVTLSSGGGAFVIPY